MNRGSTRASIELKQRYLAALRKHLAPKSRTGLGNAGRLGRQAVVAGLEPSDLTKIHKQALTSLVSPEDLAGSSNGRMARATTFLIEALTPIENVERSAAERNGHGRRKVELRLRTSELADAKRRLKRETVRRKTLEASLEMSEQHYSELLQRSRRMQEHLRRLSHQMLIAQELERKKISRELHDEIGQTLTAVNVKLATLKKGAKVTSKDITKAINSTQRLVERSMHTVHRFARELRPPLLDDLGLIPALHAHMKAFTKRTRIPTRFSTFAALEKLDTEKRTVLYRVAQEAFANIAKHAKASLVVVTIQKVDSVVRMEIHDNGKSFDVGRVLVPSRITRLGVLGMRERVDMVGGTFEVESERGKGTTIRAEIPYR